MSGRSGTYRSPFGDANMVGDGPKSERTRDLSGREAPLLPRRVLVVDDSATVRSLVKVFLMGQSLEFEEAADGHAGLQIARLTRLDAVIVDLNMPRMDGISFIKELRASDRAYLRTLPAILLTADKSPDAKKSGMAAGANAFVQKPVAKSSLQEVIEKLLPGRRAA
jgi:two-component system chemotaxis response regulator CheY